MNGAVGLGVAVWLASSGVSPAQPATPDSWALSLQLSASVFLGESAWSISHPIHGGSGGVTWETFTGVVRHRIHVRAGLELRKGRIGVRGSLGMLPQEFIQDAPASRRDLTLFLAGLSGVFYPIRPPGRVEPYVTMGLGGQKATGDMTNGGFYLNGSLGARIGLGSRVGIDAGLDLYRMTYAHVKPGSGITRDASVHPASLYLGIRVDGAGR